MSRYLKGMVVGSMIGASLAMAAGMVDPSTRRAVMHKGRNMARHYRRKFQNLDIF